MRNIVRRGVGLCLLAAPIFLGACGNDGARQAQAAAVEPPPVAVPSGSPEKGEPCEWILVSRNLPCRVSFLRLLAAPEDYEGILIRVAGYYPGRGARILFPTHESWNLNDTGSSLLIESETWLPEEDEVPGYYVAVGVFSFDRRDRNLAPGIYRQFGVLKESPGVFGVRLMTDRIRECEEAGCTIKYVQGVGPVTFDPVDPAQAQP